MWKLPTVVLRAATHPYSTLQAIYVLSKPENRYWVNRWTVERKVCPDCQGETCDYHAAQMEKKLYEDTGKIPVWTK